MRQEYSAIASTSNSNLAVPPSPSPGRPRSPDSIASASDYAERGSPGSPMLCRSPSPSPYMVSPAVWHRAHVVLTVEASRTRCPTRWDAFSIDGGGAK